MIRTSLIKRILLAVLIAVGLLGASASAQTGGATGGATTGGATTGGASVEGAATGGATTGGGQVTRAQQKAPIQNYSPVTDQRLLNPEPQNWLIYKGNYSQQAYSPLDQINTSNVSNLVPVWTFSTGETNGHEGPPMVNNGIMFATGAYNTLFALNAKTGDVLWQYARDLPQDVYPVVCCDVVNRGVALYQDKVYMATLDDHLLAFDAKTGNIVWDKTVADYTQGYAMTLAPLAVKGKILVGVSGGEYGIRGFIQAFDAKTGDPVWKTYTTAAPDQPGGDTWPGDTYKHGAASVWVTGSYDPDTNLTYWGTSNGGPWMGQVRPGDNLYVASVIALDADTGQIKAHYQYTPNESWDYDEISDQTLVTVNRNGKQMKGLIHAGRNGIFYLLDRGNNLKFVYGKPYMKSELTITGFDENGRPVIPDNRKPAINKQVMTCPSTAGGNNWFGLSYSPALGYAFIPTTEWCMDITGQQVTYQAGQTFIGAKTTSLPPPGLDKVGALQAIDVATGKVVWRTEQTLPVRSPILSTKGGLVFIGDIASREFRAFDAKTGKELWHFKTNSGIVGVPVSFEIDGVQYIAVESGARPQSYVTRPAAEYFNIPYIQSQGGVVWVFALNNQQGARAQQVAGQTGGVQTGGAQTGGVQTGGAETGGVTGGTQSGGAIKKGSAICPPQSGGSNPCAAQSGGAQTGGAQTGGAQ